MPGITKETNYTEIWLSKYFFQTFTALYVLFYQYLKERDLVLITTVILKYDEQKCYFRIPTKLYYDRTTIKSQNS